MRKFISNLDPTWFCDQVCNQKSNGDHYQSPCECSLQLEERNSGYMLKVCIILSGLPKSSIFSCWACLVSTQSLQASRHLWPHWISCGRWEGWEHKPINSVLNPIMKPFSNSPHRTSGWWPGSRVECARASSLPWETFLSASSSIPAPVRTLSKPNVWWGRQDRPAGDLRIQPEGRTAM